MSAEAIQVAIVGVHPTEGWASTAHLPALKELSEYRIQAISHHDIGIAKAAAQKFGVPKFFNSNEEMIFSPEVDLVVVTVKVPRHRELISQAISAGKAIFSEWPLGIDLAEAENLQELASLEGVSTSIGLQTRGAPAFAFARALVREGYVGEVLSATMLGSGILWGESMSERFAYTLEPANGAGMLNVPFAHSIDALLYVLDDRFQSLSGMLSNSRKSVRMLETGLHRPMPVADQLRVSGILGRGGAVVAHFRGGRSRATNFHVEINGTEGDLLITSPVGYVGIGGTRIMGARLAETLHELEIPAEFDIHREIAEPARGVAIHYTRLASDLRRGTTLSPTFTDAVSLHRLIDAVERSDGLPRRP
jgi:predicted dehydrogenase